MNIIGGSDSRGLGNFLQQCAMKVLLHCVRRELGQDDLVRSLRNWHIADRSKAHPQDL